MSSDSCFQKNYHSGECKDARVEFENVDVIPKKEKNIQAKSPKNAL